MSFLFPAFLLGALAIAIPIALHFLRRDIAPEVPFSAVRLISKSPVERSHQRRLRDLLLLAARVAALLLLAFAFARPYLDGAAAAGAAVRIVAIDRSFSMDAPGRFDEALRLAREAVDAAAAFERVAVIAFDDRADVIAPPGSAADARAAITALGPGPGGTRYAPLFARASDLAGGAPGRLVVVTDMQRSGWEDEPRGLLPDTLDLELRDVGPPPPNLAVIDVRIERERVVAVIRNAGPARAAVARLSHGGAEATSASFKAAENTVVNVPIGWRAPESGVVSVTIDDPDGLQADNSRHVLLDGGRAHVLVVTPPGSSQAGFYVSRALAAAADDDGTGADELRARVLPAPDVSVLSTEEFGGHAAVVLMSTRGLERRARDTLASVVRSGGGLLLVAAPEVEPDVVSAIFGWQPPLSAVERGHDAVALAPTDLRHPIFRPFGALAANLGHVRFSRSWHVRPEGWDVVARFTDGQPAVLERREGAGRIVLVTSDLDRRWNDFPLQPVFVPFVVESLRHLVSGSSLAREFTVASVPAGVPAEPGVHQGGGQNQAVVVNVDPRESTAATLTADEFEAMLDRISLEQAEAGEARAADVESRQSLWRYGLLLMFATLVIESFVGRSK